MTQAYPIETAPKDGTLLRLLVHHTTDFPHHMEDSLEPFWTMGMNSFLHTDEDVWKFVGWNWCQDCFVDCSDEYKGATVVGWLPFTEPRSKGSPPPEGYDTWESFLTNPPPANDHLREMMRKYKAAQPAKGRWSFDDNAIGWLTDGSSHLATRNATRPRGIAKQDWYFFAAKVCGMVNKIQGID